MESTEPDGSVSVMIGAAPRGVYASMSQCSRDVDGAGNTLNSPEAVRGARDV